MNVTNFRTAILCVVYFLCGCSMSLNAQTIDIDFEQLGRLDPDNAPDTLGTILNNTIDNNPNLFDSTPNPDGSETTLSVLNQIIDVDVPEEFGSLRFSIMAATATGGIDSNTDSMNRAVFNFSGFGIAINSEDQRAQEGVSANAPGLGNGVPESQFRLDATHDEFLTIAFSEAVIISAIGLTDLSDGETFRFGSVDITNQSENFDNPGTFGASPGSSNVQRFTFDTPLEFDANEGIFVGNTGFDPALLVPANTGVGLERIVLEVVGGSPPAPTIPEPSSLALLGLGGLLIAGRRRS